MKFFWKVEGILILSSLVVRGSSIASNNFASLYVGVPMAGKIGPQDGKPSMMLTLAEQDIIPGLEPEELRSLCDSMEISFLSLRF